MDRFSFVSAKLLGLTDAEYFIYLLDDARSIEAHWVPQKGGPRIVGCLGVDCDYCRFAVQKGTMALAAVLAASTPSFEGAIRGIWRVPPPAQPDAHRGTAFKVREGDRKEVAKIDQPASITAESFDVVAAFREIPAPVRVGEHLAKRGELSTKASLKTNYRAGTKVYASGIYTAQHWKAHAKPTRVVCLKGASFPQCVICKGEVTFKLVEQVPLITNEPMFGGTPEQPTVEPKSAKVHPRWFTEEGDGQ